MKKEKEASTANKENVVKSPTKDVQSKIEEKKTSEHPLKSVNLVVNCKDIQNNQQNKITGETTSTQDNSPSKISYEGYSPVRNLPSNFKKGEEPQGFSSIKLCSMNKEITSEKVEVV
jgi:hypothetical protein